jgi:glycosyltransferase involved in cell wall biosynthesis
MNQIREITVFTTGDSGKISTWSNVPYFFTETLLSKGIKINRVNLGPSPFFIRFYSIFILGLLRIFYKKTNFTYFRTLAHYLNARRRIKIALKKYPNADVNVFLTFSFSSVGLSNKPCIQICDWTYDHYFRYFENRKPYFFEQNCIDRENRMIEGSDFVFPLFPGIVEYMKNHYSNKNIFFLGNVINSIYEISEDEVADIKMKSNDLLFVGDKKYIGGANSLIQAFKLVKKNYPDLKLHIIGMNEADLCEMPEGIHCYGYLDKGIDHDRVIYYELFKGAKVFINTTDKWGAFSATLEAMYFYNPVIVTPYDEFVRTFGEEIKFGYYCISNAPELLQERIEEILNHPSYNSLCINSHNSVKTFTWSACVDRLLDKITS